MGETQDTAEWVLVPAEPTEAMARAAYEAARGPDPHGLFMRWARWEDLPAEEQRKWFDKLTAAIDAAPTAHATEGEKDAGLREKAIRAIREALVDQAYDTFNLRTAGPKTDLLALGCKAFGYENPEDAAEQTAAIVADAILAALPPPSVRPEVVEGWQPIETAAHTPRRGNSVLGEPIYALIPYQPTPAWTVAWWDAHDKCFRHVGDDGPQDIQPTHWMPLPEPSRQVLRSLQQQEEGKR